jgi:hypothetical protein
MSAVRLQCVHTTRLLEVFSTTHNTRETYMCRGPMAVGTVLYTGGLGRAWAWIVHWISGLSGVDMGLKWPCLSYRTQRRY